MTTDVVTVGPTTPVREIAAQLLERRISAVPVVDSERRVIGIVSEGDLMRRPEVGTERRPSWWLQLFGSSDELAQAYLKSHGRTASDVMTRHVVSVAEDAEIAHVADLLESRHIKRVPVLLRLGRGFERGERPIVGHGGETVLSLAQRQAASRLDSSHQRS